MDNVTLNPVSGPLGVEWQMSLNGGPAQGSGRYPVITVPYGASDDISITISNSMSISFADVNAFCAQAGTGIPTKCEGPFTVTGAGTNKLSIHDANNEKTATTYTYVINFKSAPRLDPIIKNGGGGAP